MTDEMATNIARAAIDAARLPSVCGVWYMVEKYDSKKRWFVVELARTHGDIGSVVARTREIVRLHCGDLCSCPYVAWEVSDVVKREKVVGRAYRLA